MYNPMGTSSLARSVLEYENGYLVGGVAINSNTYLQELTIIRIDSSGNVFDTISYGDSTMTYAPGTSGSLIAIPGNRFIWCGQAENAIKSFGFLMLIDSSFNKVWEHYYYYDTLLTYSFFGTLQVKRTFDNGYIIVGETTTQTQYDTRILLLKTDSNGIKLWQRTYNYKGADCGWNVIQTPDHGFLIGGGGYVVTNLQTYNGVVIKTDSLGNEQWRKGFGGQYADDKCIVANHPDGSFIVGQAYCEVDTNNSPHSVYNFSTITATKLDTGGNLIWFKKYDKARFWRSLNDILVTPDGNIFLLGRYRNDHNPGIQYSSILKLNPAGDSIWYREYTKFTDDDSDNELYNIKQTADNGFVMCGEAYAPFTPFQKQHMWVLKVDSFGCDTPGCQTASIKEPIQSVEKLDIYPVPAHSFITIQLPQQQINATLELWSTEGRLLRQEEIAVGISEYSVNLEGFSPGVYMVLLRKGERIVGSGRFVKE